MNLATKIACRLNMGGKLVIGTDIAMCLVRDRMVRLLTNKEK